MPPTTTNKKAKSAPYPLPTQDALLLVPQTLTGIIIIINLDFIFYYNCYVGILSLQPVPIGIFQNDAPRQRTELVNVSANDIAYEVDHVSIDRFIEGQNNVPLIQLINPRGIIIIIIITIIIIIIIIRNSTSLLVYIFRLVLLSTRSYRLQYSYYHIIQCC